MMSKSSNQKYRLLFVNDDLLVTESISKNLKARGYTVNTAASVDEVENSLQSNDWPDLVLLDINLPKSEGLQLVDRLRLYNHIPFIILSALIDARFIAEVNNFGALNYLHKPIDLPDLTLAIEAALTHHHNLGQQKITEQQLQQALDNERDIRTAVGITMVKHQLARKDAFELLRSTARDQRRKLSELASDMIQTFETLILRPKRQKNI
jgi:response regulator NasT